MVFSVGFFGGFLKNPLRTGAVTPSSPFLARKMLQGIDFAHVDTVVELGPGTGPFTKELVRRMRPGTKLILVELNPDFAQKLERRFGGKVHVENVSAERIDDVLAKHGSDRADLIVCGLAFPVMPAGVRETIMEAITKHVGRGTIFRMFSYVPGRISKIFPQTRFRRLSKTWLNVPPATVLTVE